MSRTPRSDLRLPIMKSRRPRLIDTSSLKVVSKYSTASKEDKRKRQAEVPSDDALTAPPATEQKTSKTVISDASTTAAVGALADEEITDAPSADAAPAEAAPADAAPTEEAPATEAPATEAPTTEAIVTDAPAPETSATEAPVADAPATEASTTTATTQETTTTASKAPTAEASAKEPTSTRLPVGCSPDADYVRIKEQLSHENPRDTADSIKGSAKMQKLAMGEETHPVCTSGEEDAVVEAEKWKACPGTPGDQSTQDWLQYERPESPDAIMPQAANKIEDTSNLTETQLEERMCKRRHTRQKYIKMWGSEEAVRRFTKLKLEARRKRKQLEKRHAQNTWLREKMRNHARKKRRMYRCKDQSKIPSLNEDIQINRAFYYRFNYNNQVPCMPTDMDKHFGQFKKPPFKNTGLSGCVKAVDEFEKLRVQQKTP